MKSIFDKTTIATFEKRVKALRSDSTAKWGKMNVAQMLSHLNFVTKTTFGETDVKQPFIGKLIGRMILKKSLKDDSPIGKNKPTHPAFVFSDKRDFAKEQSTCINLINQYPTKNPGEFEGRKHPFFGKMSSDEWDMLIYKHLDHHLRQFGV